MAEFLKQWLVLWKNNGRLGSVELTEAHRRHFHAKFYMHLLQTDWTGTEHWELTGVKKSPRRDKLLSLK